MFTSLIMPFLSLLLTIVFGVISLTLMTRTHYLGRITFLRYISIGLFDTIIKNFSQIKILYDNDAISEQLVFLKGAFINTGNIDISKDLVEKAVTVELPKECRWINANVVAKSPQLECIVQTIPDKLLFTLGLFRKNEFFQFEALAEVMNTEIPLSKLSDNLEIRYRIANTNRIEKTESISDVAEITRKKRRDFKIGIIYAVIFLVFVFNFNYMDYAEQTRQQIPSFIVSNEKGETINDYRLFAEYEDRGKKAVLPLGKTLGKTLEEYCLQQYGNLIWRNNKPLKVSGLRGDLINIIDEKGETIHSNNVFLEYQRQGIKQSIPIEKVTVTAYRQPISRHFFMPRNKFFFVFNLFLILACTVTLTTAFRDYKYFRLYRSIGGILKTGCQ